MTSEHDDRSVRRYRAASEALDERPSAATRAAILAAAARQVDARPQSADAPRVAHRRRWPLAAAAAVLLSTLAVMMATRTEQQMPTFTAPADALHEKAENVPAAPPVPSTESGPVATTGVASPARESPAAAPPVATERPAANATIATRQKHTAPRTAPDDAAGARSSSGGASAPSRSMQATPAEPVTSAESRRAADVAAPAAPAMEAPRVAPPPPAVATPAPAAAGSLAAPGSARERAPDERAVAAKRARNEAAESAPAPADAAAVRDFERSPPQWIDHIVRLRSEGRAAEADAELKRFRERYPEVPLPPAALPAGAAGTR